MDDSKGDFIELTNLEEIKLSVCFLHFAATATIRPLAFYILSLGELVVNKGFLFLDFPDLDGLEKSEGD